jgi:hypothetical protein
MPAQAKVGNTVRFTYQGKTRQGKVIHLGNTQAVIEARADGVNEGGTITVPLSAIFKILK